jgi:lauroyl/myristoyl acyltransferase
VTGRAVAWGHAVEWAYAAGWRLIRAMPRSWAWWIFRTAADRAARRRGPGAQRLERNLRRVVGPAVSPAEIDVLVRDGLRSYARYWLEAFRLPKLSKEQILRDFHLERGHLLGEAVEAGTGCVVALPHAGNWDAGGAWVCAKGWPITTVAERLKPEGLYQRFVDFRESLGMEIIPSVGGERSPIDVLADRIGQGRVVPLLADRDLSARGVEVEFFGGRTRMPAGPALLAIRTGAPLYVVSLWYEPAGPRGKVVGPLNVPDPRSGPLDVRVRALTQTVADHLAEGIAEHPSDWHMLQRLWLDDKPKTRTLDMPKVDKPAGDRGSAALPAEALPADALPADAVPADAVSAERPVPPGQSREPQPLRVSERNNAAPSAEQPG